MNEKTEKIIFLDIDGVLNCNQSFKDGKEERRFYHRALEDGIEKDIKIMLLDIDIERINILKRITDLTGSKIVVTSSWRNLKLYTFVEEYLIQCGLPVIDRTSNIGNKRGEEIREYLKTHPVDKFMILDDDIFRDFNELVNYLVKTDFYNNGLEERHIDESISILGLKKPQ